MPNKRTKNSDETISTATPGIKAPDKHEVTPGKQPGIAASGHSHTGNGGGKGLTTDNDKTIEQLTEHLASEQNVLGNTNIFTK